MSQPTVSVALKALAEEGYVFTDNTHEVHMTEKGKRIAEDTYEDALKRMVPLPVTLPVDKLFGGAFDTIHEGLRN